MLPKSIVCVADGVDSGVAVVLEGEADSATMRGLMVKSQSCLSKREQREHAELEKRHMR